MNLDRSLDFALGLNNQNSSFFLFEAENDEITDQPVVLSRTEWMTSDPETLFKAAFTNNSNAFWSSLNKLAVEIGDEGLQDQIKTMRSELRQAKGDDSLKQYVLDKYKPLRQKARREARDYAVERMATQPTRSWPGRIGPDRLGWSKKDLEAHYNKIKERRESQQKNKKYYGDELYGIYKDGEQVEGEFRTKQSANSALQGNVGKYPDPSEYSILKYSNKKSLSTLKDIKYPTSKEIHGKDAWTPEEIINALKPYIYRSVNRFKSNMAPPEDLFQQGALGVLDAIRTDKGEGKFGSHAFRHISGAISNWARQQGVIKGKKSGSSPLAKSIGKHGGAMGFRSRGPLEGYNAIWIKDGEANYEFFPMEKPPEGKAARRTGDPGYLKAKEFLKQKKAEGASATGIDDVRKNIASTSAPIGGDSPTSLGATLKATKTVSPSHIARVRDELVNLHKRGKVTDKQWEVMQKAFGLDDPDYGMGGAWSRENKPGQFGPPETGEEDEMSGTYIDDPNDPTKLKWQPHDVTKRPPGTQSGQEARKLTGKGKDLGMEKNPTQIAKELGMSATRVRQQLAKGLSKIRDSVPMDLDRTIDKIMSNLQKKQGVKYEDIYKAESLMLVERFTRHIILKLLVEGDLDGTCLTEAA